MDPLTHYLSAKLTFGLLVKEKTRKYISLFMLSAVFPDIDFLMRIFGRAVYLKYHRGITHSFVGIFILSLMLALIFARKELAAKNFTEVRRLFFLAFVSMLIHILLDWTNSYGTQLFLPFSKTRAALDSIFIIDIYLLGSMSIALTLLQIFKNRDYQISLVFTTLIVCYILFKVGLNFATVSKIKTLNIGDEQMIGASAFPDMFLPTRFKCVVETKSKYYLFDYNIFKKNNTKINDYTKNHEDDYIRAAKKSYLGKVMVDFLRFPYSSSQREGDNRTIVTISDLRFKYNNGRKGFAATFVVDDNLNVIDEKFRF